MSSEFGLPHRSDPLLPFSLPRATRILRGTSTSGELWMGGAHSERGSRIPASRLAGAILVDCAGDLHPSYGAAAGARIACVFSDIDSRPARLEEIVAVARRVAAAVADAASPRDAFVFCQYGMNRSGLVAGLVLRELGMAGSEAIALLRAERPGALSNVSYARVILEHAASIGGDRQSR